MTKEEEKELQLLLEDIEQREIELFTLRALASYYKDKKDKDN